MPPARNEPVRTGLSLQACEQFSSPHRDFATVERIFGDVNAEASDAVFRFGSDGKPLYIPGPNDTAPLIRRRIEQLRKHLGDEGFSSP